MPDLRQGMRDAIQEKAKAVTDPAGREVRILEEAGALRIAHGLGAVLKEVYVEALRAGVCPYRYLRNREAISLEEQLALAESRVGVVGAGGLGGHVILLLARIGVGQLVVVDHDVFDETNLNRQALSNTGALGDSKCRAAEEAVEAVNPSVEVISQKERLDRDNASALISGCRVVVDALDNIQDRFLLEEAVKRHGIPLVHGALAGFEGQLMTIYPQDPGLSLIYGNEGGPPERKKSPEAVLGVPALMPALIATLQAMEVVKILLNRGRVFRNVMVHVDMETGRMEEFTLKAS